MNNYEDGKEYFLKGTAQAGDSLGWSVVFFYNNGIGVSCGKLSDEPGLLLTAEEICTGEDSCKRLKELDAVNHEQAEKILSLQRDLMTAKANYNSCSDELAECKATIAKQTNKLMELQARIVELNEVNSSLGENRDALNNEAEVHMTSIHNLQVAVEVLAEKIFEMRCEQDG